MAISNLALIKHLDGRPVAAEDIKVGLSVYFPSGFGGVIEHKCVLIDPEKAEFESSYRDWPGSFLLEFDQPDFTRADFELLSDALKAYSGWNGWPTSEQRAIARRAHEMGYARVISYTQAEWSDKGIESYRALNRHIVFNRPKEDL